MRGALISVAFMLAAVCVVGQTPIPQPYLALMGGGTLSTPGDREVPYSWVVRERQVRTGFIGSVEGGFPMTRYVGVHFAFLGTSQDFTLTQFYVGQPYGGGKGTAPVNILEVGPEFTWCPTKNQELFAQLNLGHTVGSESVTTTFEWPWYSYQRTEHLRDNEWVLGLAIGYRWYFSKAVGLSVQVTCHRVSGWDFSPIWAAQAGVVFRF
jgi:hypothetical protein